jgi:hypothetical protein
MSRSVDRPSSAFEDLWLISARKRGVDRPQIRPKEQSMQRLQIHHRYCVPLLREISFNEID